MKKFIAIILCVIMTLSFAACSEKTTSDNEDSQVEQKSEETSISLEENSAQMPNPFIDCETIEEAEELAGFTIKIPKKLPKGFYVSSIRVIKNELIEIVIEDEENTVYFRKGKGNEDISGDYNEYEKEKIVKVGDLDVKLRGNDGKINAATWSDGEYSYAIVINSGKEGIYTEIVVDIINNIQQ